MQGRDVAVGRVPAKRHFFSLVEAPKQLWNLVGELMVECKDEDDISTDNEA
jgi:hypothetical protein